MSSAKGAGALPVLGATLLAAIQPVSAWAGIHGSSVAGIHGSSSQGIHGSSANGIHGSSVDGIHGSSANGIHGSSVDGIHGSSANGIHGSSVDGIHGSSANGIHGSSVDGIHGSSANGIHGSSVDGIHGSSANGIHGSSVDGIHGSSANGIHGSSANGIHGSSVDGIHGSSANGIHGSSISGIHGSSAAGIHGSSALVLAGPVDSIDPINGVFMAMGQTVMASQGMLSSMSVGDFVSVNGSVVSSGWLYADAISVANGMYVPGATEVFVTGIPSGIDPVLGQAQLGELTIDYTAAMSGGAIPAGLSLSFSGIRPVDRGMLVSDRVNAIQ
jgi:hypothetical protein